MADKGITITFNFPKTLTPAEGEIIGKAMAELIKLNPEALDEAAWSFSINGSAVQAYQLGVETVKLMETLAAIKKTAPKPTVKPAKKKGRRA